MLSAESNSSRRLPRNAREKLNDQRYLLTSFHRLFINTVFNRTSKCLSAKFLLSSSLTLIRLHIIQQYGLYTQHTRSLSDSRCKRTPADAIWKVHLHSGCEYQCEYSSQLFHKALSDRSLCRETTSLSDTWCARIPLAPWSRCGFKLVESGRCSEYQK